MPKTLLERWIGLRPLTAVATAATIMAGLASPAHANLNPNPSSQVDGPLRGQAVEPAPSQPSAQVRTPSPEPDAPGQGTGNPVRIPLNIRRDDPSAAGARDPAFGNDCQNQASSD